MTALLRKRLKRIEAEVTTPGEARMNVAILTEPDEEDEPDEMKRYEKALNQAIRDHENVIVISARYKERTEVRGGLVYVPSEIQALIERLSSRPTTRRLRTPNGNDTAWIAGLKSSVFGVVPKATDPNY